MDYKRAILLAEDVTRSYNGKQDQLWTNTDLYSAYRQGHASKLEVNRLEKEVQRLKTENNVLRNSTKGKGGDNQSRTPPRGMVRKSGGGGVSFLEERKEVCKHWNLPVGCKAASCGYLHVCNAKTTSGRCCKSKAHKGPDHK